MHSKSLVPGGTTTITNDRTAHWVTKYRWYSRKKQLDMMSLPSIKLVSLRGEGHPRKLITDRFKPRGLKIANITVTDYLKAMNIMDDVLVTQILADGWQSPWVVDRARREIEKLNDVSNNDEPGETGCNRLIDLIKGRQ